MQIGGSTTSFGATAFCTFSLIDGTYAAQAGVTASVTQISSDTYDFSVRLLWQVHVWRTHIELSELSVGLIFCR